MSGTKPSEGSFALRSRNVVMPHEVRPATVRAAGGTIVAVEPFEAGADAEDLGDAWLLPGLVDTHVHVNEPGRTEWEGFTTATRAAAAGGITTIVDMPLNSIPATTTVKALAAKVAAARGQCHVDVAFWGGLVPGNRDELEPLVRAGVRGFKCFLAPSGVDEFRHVDDEDLRLGLPSVGRLGVPLLVHAEAPVVLERAMQEIRDRTLKSHRRGLLWFGEHSSWELSRPPKAEALAIRMLTDIAHRSPVSPWVHVVHAASGAACDAIEAALPRCVITAETCPHYLFFDASRIAIGHTEFKCAPPLRGGSERAALWEALERGTLGMIVSDHSPSPPEARRGDFFDAWGGIASLECSLAAVWTARRAHRPEEALEESATRIGEWMARRPALLAGLGHAKGEIGPGFDADLVMWHPERRWLVDPTRLHQRHPITPYAGCELWGRVERTWLRGRCVFDRGDFRAPSGRLLLEPRGALG